MNEVGLKAFLVDDEKKALGLLENRLGKIEGMVISGSAGSVEEAVASIPKASFDVLFLDVELRDGSGFDLLRKLEEIDFQVVFITAFDKYAIDAFKVNAIDYLLKPVEPSELLKCVQKVRKNLGSDVSKTFEKLSDAVNRNFLKDRLAIRERGKITFIDLSSIRYLKADGAYTEIHTLQNKKFTTSQNLKYYEPMLENLGFLRIHRSYIVNVREISEYFTNDHLISLRNCSDILPISPAALVRIVDMGVR